jgi:HEAT repeat protein
MLDDAEADRIRVTLDRSRTPELLEFLLNEETDAETATTVERVIRCLEDVRVVPTLLRLIEALDAPSVLRERALSVLIDASVYVADLHTRRRWYAGGDVVQIELALACSDRRDAANIVAVLESPNHPLRIAATVALAFGFEEPEWQQRKIALLSDADPAVRAAAASALLWNEPITAEPALLRAVSDSDDDVACDALDTLRYYQSTAVFDALLRVRVESGSLRRFDMATRSLDDLVESAVDGLNGMCADNVYAAQFRERLAAYEEQRREANETVGYHPTPNPTPEQESPTAGALAQQLSSVRATLTGTNDPETFDDLQATLEDFGGEWEAKYTLLREFDVTRASPKEQMSLTNIICAHSDPMVRSIGSDVLAKFGRVSDLVALLADPIPHVAKSARYALRHVEPNADVAELVIRPVLNGEIAGTQASEAIETWTRHHRALVGDAVIGELVALAEDERESVRLSAIEELVAIDAPVGAQMIPYLKAKPLVTWAVHTTIISGRRHLGLSDTHVREATSQWQNIDNLWLQIALSELSDP